MYFFLLSKFFLFCGGGCGGVYVWFGGGGTKEVLWEKEQDIMTGLTGR